MQCPVCKDTALLMSERQGIEIDYCPQCRGVWLDRGELDKIIQRSLANMAEANGTPAASAPPPSYPPADNHNSGHGHHGGYDQRQQSGHYQKRKKSFWEDLFD